MTEKRSALDYIYELTRLPEFPNDPKALERIFRLLAIWRQGMATNTIISNSGLIVQGGPFKGMTFVREAAEGVTAPKLLGAYEVNVHHIIERIIASDFRTIVNIGCAEGYYAVGFALRMPKVVVHAFDLDPFGRDLCATLARENGVSDRVRVDGEFLGSMFADLAGAGSLVFLDAEGAEDALLRPDDFPALKSSAIFVECHDVLKPGLSTAIAARFADTHDIETVGANLLCATDLPEWMSLISHLDQLVTLNERRQGPTPWLYMTPRAAKVSLT